jgi:hypothetical protein
MLRGDEWKEKRPEISSAFSPSRVSSHKKNQLQEQVKIFISVDQSFVSVSLRNPKKALKAH